MPHSNQWIFLGVIFTLLQCTLQELLSREHFINTKPMTWNEAKEDCEFYYWGNGSLLDIDTEDEFKRHHMYLASHEDLVGTFWVGGKFDTASNKFIWDKNGEKVPGENEWSENPWKNDVPDSLTESTRLFLEHTGEHETKLAYSDGFETRGYICEDKHVKSGVCARSKYMDLVFGVDYSYSMKANVSKAAFNFIYNVIKSIHPFLDNRFAVFQYADREEETVWLLHLKNNITAYEDIGSVLFDYASHTYGNLHSFGIETAAKEIFDNERPNVAKNIVMITDSEYEPEHPNPIDTAKKFMEMGINVFSVRMITPEFPAHRQEDIDNAVNMAGGRSDRAFLIEDRVKLIEALCET